MHTCNVKVLPSILVFGGWRGELTIDDDGLTIVDAEGGRRLAIRPDAIKRASFNGNNGLWVLTPTEGTRIRFQTAGWLLSGDRTPAGKSAAKEANPLIKALFREHGVRVFGL